MTHYQAEIRLHTTVAFCKLITKYGIPINCGGSGASEYPDPLGEYAPPVLIPTNADFTEALLVDFDTDPNKKEYVDYRERLSQRHHKNSMLLILDPAFVWQNMRGDQDWAQIFKDMAVEQDSARINVHIRGENRS